MPATTAPVLDVTRFAELSQPSLTACELRLRPLGVEHVPMLLSGYAEKSIIFWHGRRLDEAEARDMVESNPRHWLAGTRADGAVSNPVGPLARVGLNHVDLFAGDAHLHARFASDPR